MKKWELLSKSELENIINSSCSYSEVAHKIGYTAKCGGINKHVKELINFYKFDVSHFKGQHWARNKFDYSRFKYGNNIRPANFLDAIAHLRGRKCESCCLETWLNNPIKLEVHHKDGDRLNNNLDNLQLLCPNCHSFTDTWRGGNNKSRKYVTDDTLIENLKNSKSIYQALIKSNLRTTGGDYKRARKLINKYNIIVGEFYK